MVIGLKVRWKLTSSNNFLHCSAFLSKMPLFKQEIRMLISHADCNYASRCAGSAVKDEKSHTQRISIVTAENPYTVV